MNMDKELFMLAEKKGREFGNTDVIFNKPKNKTQITQLSLNHTSLKPMMHLINELSILRI